MSHIIGLLMSYIIVWLMSHIIGFLMYHNIGLLMSHIIDVLPIFLSVRVYVCLSNCHSFYLTIFLS